MKYNKYGLPIYPFKKVVSTEFVSSKYARPGEGCYWFDLECGHTAFAKASDGTPQRKRCRDCGMKEINELNQQ